MSEHIREIAERLRTMRDIIGIGVEELVSQLSITAEQYREIETGEVDIPVSVLWECAKVYGIDVTELLTGDKAKLHQYFLCRRNRGIAVERADGYYYKALASGFSGRKVEPLYVTIPAATEHEAPHFNAHGGQEFHHCMKGSFTFYIDGHSVVVTGGDSVYFDSKYPHAMSAMGGQDAEILVVVIN
ncbi:MAG: cupin domain-containing protein [Clostridiales bacterium]|nr:cupin domain-containing protein [Clostridiales bacterium]